MKHLFLPYNLSLLAKEKGFEEYCFYRYGVEGLEMDFCRNNDPNFKRRGFTSAPLYQQIVDWFREKHNINIGLTYFDAKGTNWWSWRLHYEDRHGSESTYYKALTKAIKEAFKLI